MEKEYLRKSTGAVAAPGARASTPIHGPHEKMLIVRPGTTSLSERKGGETKRVIFGLRSLGGLRDTRGYTAKAEIASNVPRRNTGVVRMQ